MTKTRFETIVVAVVLLGFFGAGWVTYSALKGRFGDEQSTPLKPLCLWLWKSDPEPAWFQIAYPADIQPGDPIVDLKVKPGTPLFQRILILAGECGERAPTDDELMEYWMRDAEAD